MKSTLLTERKGKCEENKAGTPTCEHLQDEQSLIQSPHLWPELTGLENMSQLLTINAKPTISIPHY